MSSWGTVSWPMPIWLQYIDYNPKNAHIQTCLIKHVQLWPPMSSTCVQASCIFICAWVTACTSRCTVHCQYVQGCNTAQATWPARSKQHNFFVLTKRALWNVQWFVISSIMRKQLVNSLNTPKHAHRSILRIYSELSINDLYDMVSPPLNYHIAMVNTMASTT